MRELGAVVRTKGDSTHLGNDNEQFKSFPKNPSLTYFGQLNLSTVYHKINFGTS